MSQITSVSECKSVEDEVLVVMTVCNEKEGPSMGETCKPGKNDADGCPQHLPQNGWKDTWALFAFLLTVGMTVGWGMTLPIEDEISQILQGIPNLLDRHGLGGVKAAELYFGVGVGIPCAGISAMLSLLLLQALPSAAIVLSTFLFSAVLLISSAVAFYKSITPTGVTLAVLGLLYPCWLYFVRSRIAFSANLLATASFLTQQIPLLFLIPAMLTLPFLGYMIWSLLVLHATVKRGQYNDCLWANYIFGLTSIFSIFWAANVVLGLSHVTTAGVVAKWYFAGSENMPAHPTWASFQRAITTSFGSVCLGSLLSTLVGAFGWVCGLGIHSGNEFIDCSIACIQDLFVDFVNYCNSYAYVQVAMHGRGYMTSARRVWRLCQNCGCSAVFNDALVLTTLRVMTVSIPILAGVGVALFSFSATIGSIACVLTVIPLTCILSVVSAVVRSIFVCFAELPEGLEASFPELHAALMATDYGFASIHNQEKDDTPV
ncbi:hypothetical protein C3747_101g85 [Trypanosoma cruzi]|uniref:Choline transporter-like protein n=2 Tax=Trypanosoma cruzi TaxID=5693 RepID=Q4DIL1_TRYCC|nr:hypothetical protein, conserved [Trypanosoma cruzi]EAN92357.1 hypothetical protein, conserved [Trypanosoma cruzi]PWV07511.1 hypothetical protein C3747_101g85 [Trypanosoma cruzi]RNC58525.1 hypothetical protein TcCL_ESM03887 [Trypanosoma cruzi]|eukprot:XP_814208.1 hypothetical protein [Trypanosoma cruzi strain CL Brener]